MLLTLAQIKTKSFESRWNSFFLSFFLPGVDAPHVCVCACVRACVRVCVRACVRACLGARLLLQSYQYSNRSEGADRVGRQLRG